MYKEGVPPEEGRDTTGRWFMIKRKTQEEEEIDNSKIPF
jgi:hypothetical protein